MPNALYDKAREAFLKGEIKWRSDATSDQFRVALVKGGTGGYVPDLANHVTLQDIDPSQILQTSSLLTGRTTAAGVADADNVTFSTATNTAVPAGDIRGIVIYQDGGTASTSKLIAYLDQINGLPFVTTGSSTNLTIQWDDGPNKIFKL